MCLSASYLDCFLFLNFNYGLVLTLSNPFFRSLSHWLRCIKKTSGDAHWERSSALGAVCGLKDRSAGVREENKKSSCEWAGSRGSATCLQQQLGASFNGIVTGGKSVEKELRPLGMNRLTTLKRKLMISLVLFKQKLFLLNSDKNLLFSIADYSFIIIEDEIIKCNRDAEL